MTENSRKDDRTNSFDSKPLPFDELLSKAPDIKCDLVDGRYIHHSPASFRHNTLRRFLESVLSMYVEEKNLGLVFSENFPVKLDESNWREPDIVFVPESQVKLIEKTIFRGIPSHIIEIISEDSRYRDEVRKRAEYERLGVAEYWIIDPDSFEKSSFLVLDNNRYENIDFSEDKLESSVIPNFFILNEWIWGTEKPPKILEACKALGLL